MKPIKSIHKFALSYTQEFSLAVLSRNVSTLTFQNNFVFQSKLSKVFVHVSRCLIYKVHRCSRSLYEKLSVTSSSELSAAVHLLHNSTLFSVCQALFSSFLRFFRVCFASRKVLRYSIKETPVCQHLF